MKSEQKKLILILALIFCLITIFAFGRDITFTWTANTESDLAGYRLYETLVSRQYTFGDGYQVATIPAGTETATITVLDENADFLYWVLTAFTTEMLESGASNEVSVPPSEGGGGGGCFINSIK